MNLKNFILIPFLVLFFFVGAKAQEKSLIKQSFRFSLAHGHEDGFKSEFNFPILGIGYEYHLNKSFALYAGLHTFFRRDRQLIIIDQELPFVGRVDPDLPSPFLSQEDIEKFENLGILNFDRRYALKAFSIPLTLGVKTRLLGYKKHGLNVYAGVAVIYENKNFFLEYIRSSATVTTIDNQTQTLPLILTSETNFRYVVASEHLAIGYEYTLPNSSIELYLGERALFLGHANISLYYDLSLRFKIKI